MKVLVWDLECRENPAEKGWRNYKDHGISIGCAFLDWINEYRFYYEDNIAELVNDLDLADVISGFNILNYDFNLLSATMERIGCFPENGFDHLLEKTYDPYQDICRALKVKIPGGWKLENLALSNLSIQKNGNGADAPGLYKNGDFDTLKSYVKRDVEVEYALFKYCREHGTLTNNFLGLSPVTIQLSGMASLLEKFDWKKEAT